MASTDKAEQTVTRDRNEALEGPQERPAAPHTPPAPHTTPEAPSGPHSPQDEAPTPNAPTPDEIRQLLGAHLPATERLVRELAETVRDIREHQAQPGTTPGDLYSGNLHGWMGERMAQVLTRLANAEDRVAELEAYANGCDAEGCVIPHSSWCEAAKKTAAENDGCTCGRPWEDHPQPHAMHCWVVNPPRAEVEEMRRALAAARAEVLGEVAAWLVNKAREYPRRNKLGRTQADVALVLASKIARGAVRPDNLRMLPNPGFFEHGRTYVSGTWEFRCEAISPSPGTGEPRALGWKYAPVYGVHHWHAVALDPDDWKHGGWTEVTEDGEARA